MIQGREFVSPHDGIVVAVLKNKGETVAPERAGLSRGRRRDGAAFRAISTSATPGRSAPGSPCASRPRSRESSYRSSNRLFTGRVEYVDPEVSPDNQTCKVVAVVENHDGLLRAGLEARMEIHAETTGGNADETRPCRPCACGGIGFRDRSAPLP